MAALAPRRSKAPPAVLREALRGRVTNHHHFLLQLQHIKALDTAIDALDREVDTQIEPFRVAILLTDHHTRDQRPRRPSHLHRDRRDMGRFPNEAHLLSWAGFCPRNDESPTGQARGLKAHGERQSNRMRKGARWLKTTQIQCAWAATRKNGSHLQAQFRRLRARRGAKRQSALLPPRSSPPPTTCSKTAPSIMISVPTTSITAPRPGKRLLTRQQPGYAVQITPLAA